MDKKKQGTQTNSINRYLAELKTLLNKAVEWERIKYNPIDGLKKLKAEDDTRVRYLSDDERKRLFWALDEREQELKEKRINYNKWRIERDLEPLIDITLLPYADYLKPMIILALNTGMRRGEIFNLTWANVNLSEARITITASTAKSKKKRYLPLPIVAIDMLRKWKKQNKQYEYVFTNKDGKPFTGVKTSWANLMKKAGIGNFSFHDMRHDYASQLIMKGADLYTVKELLGHSTIQMTERYAHLKPDAFKNAVDLLNS